MKKFCFIKTSILALWCLVPVFGQIDQDQPELCGDKTRITVVPPGLSAAINRTNATAVLSFGLNHTVDLQGINGEIHEVCPLPSNKLVSFGLYVGYDVNIIDTLRYTVADSFVAYDPVMSPNQRWIASRHFHAPQTEIQISEEYLLYDLNASTSENQHNVTPYTSDVTGWAMYPALPGNAPVDLADIPDSNTHEWRSKSFFWAPDSQSVVFADKVGQNLSLVLVLIRNDKPQAYTHALSSAEICGGSGSGEPDLMLENASIASVSGNVPTVVASFHDSNDPSTCHPRQLTLNSYDFQPAPAEVLEHRKRKESTGVRQDR